MNLKEPEISQVQRKSHITTEGRRRNAGRYKLVFLEKYFRTRLGKRSLHKNPEARGQKKGGPAS